MRTLFLIAAVLVGLALPAQAWAAAWATIERIEVLDETGRWQVQRETGLATRTRGDETLPVSLGQDLAQGDTLTTQGARLRVRYSGGGQLSVQPESALALQEWGCCRPWARCSTRSRGSSGCASALSRPRSRAPASWSRASPTVR